MKKPVIFAYFFTIFGFFLLNNQIALAHGDENVATDLLHAPVQIGLRESKGISLTRHEVAGLVHQVQKSEEARSFIKFSILLIFVFLVIWLFWPKKRIEINTQQKQ